MGKFQNVIPDLIGYLQDALTSPGIDTRVWVSYGTVDTDKAEDEGGRAIEFNADLGPLVRVILQPDDNIVTCRVAAGIAGSLEGEWNPMGPGDEVLVVIPGGNTLCYPVILGRLNNELDQFPTKVAGKEVGENNLGFRRTRVPFILETASLWMVRSAVTGAAIGIDETGNLTIRDGNSNALQFGPNGFAVQDKDGTGQIAIDTEKGFASVWWQNTLMKMDGTDMSLAASGNIAIGSAGNIPILHAITIEQSLNLLSAYLNGLSTALAAIGATPLTGASLAAVINPLAAGAALLVAAIYQAQGNVNPAYTPAINSAIQTAIMGSQPITPVTPGACCPAIVMG